MAETRSAVSAWVRFEDASHPRAVAVAAATLLSLYCGLALAYRDSVPLFAAADEAAHLHYAVFLQAEGRLPHLQPNEVPGEGEQPPLVYAIAAPLLGAPSLDAEAAEAALLEAGLALEEPGQGPKLALRALAGQLAGFGIVRGTSLAFGLLAVILTFAAVWRASQDARLSLLAGSLLAFNPEFLFVSGTFSNDAATAAVGAGALWIFVRSLEDPETGPGRRDYLALGALLAVGLLTKISTLPVVIATFVTMLAIDRRSGGARALDLALASGIVLVVAGPYLVWSDSYRGGPLGIEAVLAGARGAPRPEAFGGYLSYWLSVYWDRTFDSYWAGFGGLTGGLPKALYLAFFALTWTGVLGFVAGRHAEPLDPLGSRSVRGYLVAAIAAALLAHFVFNSLFVAPEGRHLFASAPQIAFLIALGWLRLLASERRILALTLGLVAVLLVLDLVCLRSVLLPAVAALP